MMLLLFLFASVAARAQMPTYNLGRTPSPEEIRSWDISAYTGKSLPLIGPMGKELPPGSATARQGEKVFAQWCAKCHGLDGKYQWPYRVHMPSGGKAPVLAGETGAVRKQRQFAPSLWDYINRAMPLGQGGTLSADEVYGATAYLLYLSGIIKQDDVMDAQTLPKVQMPNRPRPLKP
jgi:mono/diheme cytochrome c family protein